MIRASDLTQKQLQMFKMLGDNRHGPMTSDVLRVNPASILHAQ